MHHHIVTFHKAGSTWFRRIFRGIADSKLMSIEVHPSNRFRMNSNVARDSPDTLHLYRSEKSFAEFSKRGVHGPKPVLCVRDPKDIVVSQYYSWLKTHQLNSETLLEYRDRLVSTPMEEGIKLLIKDRAITMANVMRDWMPLIQNNGAHFLRYERVLSDFEGALSETLTALGIELPVSVLTRLKEENSFKALTNREPGEEDTSKHNRKGIAGDWMNHFDQEIMELFDRQYADLCEMLGYPPACARPQE